MSVVCRMRQNLYHGSMNRLRKQLAGLILLTFLASMILGAVLTSEMMMHDGMMEPCPFMGVPSLCNMSPLEHVSAWQHMFIATLQPYLSSFLLLLLSLLLAPAFSNIALQLKPPRIKFAFRTRYRERIFDPLQSAFSRGILNTKIYS